MNAKTAVQVLIVVVLLLAVDTSCGGGKRAPLDSSSTPLTSAEVTAATVESGYGAGPSLDELKAVLAAEFDRLGIDPEKVAATAPQGRPDDPRGEDVFDLALRELPGGGAMRTIEFSWTERVLGDYDQNGEVNIADLTPLGLRFRGNVLYQDPGSANGLLWWPVGDPAGLGADNWRKARIDGDANGEINIADITPIAVHWQERLDGYRLYRQGSGEDEFIVVPDPDNPSEPLLIARPAVEQGEPVRYVFEFEDDASEEVTYCVVPYDAVNDDEGQRSNEVMWRPGFPIARVWANPTTGSAPLKVNFDAGTSDDPDGSVVQFDWDWDGDGTFDLENGGSQLAHVYDEIGNYDAAVRVLDDEGKTDIVHVSNADRGVGTSINVGNTLPVADLVADPTEGAAPLTVTLDASGSYDPDGYITKYEWDWEGGGSYDYDSGTNPIVQHEYAEGIHHPIVRVTDNLGANDTSSDTASVEIRAGYPPVAILAVNPDEGNQPLEVTLDASASYDTNGSIVKYVWDWEGDEAYDYDSGVVSIVQHTYNDSGEYLATIRVVDNDGLTHTDKQKITVGNIPPVADLSADPTSGNKQLAVDFDASGSTDVDGQIVYYQFDFGEGAGWETPVTTGVAQHTYSASGDYTARVQVQDDDDTWCDVPASVAIHVNYPPLANLQAAPTSGDAPLQVGFDASGSTDSDGTIEQYDYDWTSDGSYDLLDGGATSSHEYTSSGDYAATVRVTDNDGAQTTAQSDTIAVNIPPVADLQADPVSGGAPLTVEFDASGSTDSDGVIEQYDYDWEGDGTYDLIDGSLTPSHLYTTDGTFNAIVRVTDDDGAQDTDSVTITVYATWTHTWGNSGYEATFGVAVNNGDVYATGQTDIDGLASDVLLYKYNEDGDLLWTKSWGGTSNDIGRSIAIDSSDNIIIGGMSASFGAGGSDVLLLKYSSAETLEWAKTWGGSGSEWGFGVGTDSGNNIYVAGSTYSYGAGESDLLLVKFNAAGEFQWARTWGGTGQEESTRGIAVTNAGDSYFTGETTTFDVGLQDVCTVKFNSTGSLQWARTWGTSDNDIGRTTALDSSGNVYVAGATRPGAYLGFLVLKYDSSGSLLWERYWSCGGGNSEAYGLLVNSDNFVYATGYYGSGGIYEIPLVKFDTEGVFYWGESWNDEGTQDGYFLALDSLGLLIIGGSAPNNTGSWGSLTGSSGTPSGTESTPSGTVTSPTGTVTSPVGTEGSPTGTEDTGGGGYDALVLKLDADGL